MAKEYQLDENHFIETSAKTGVNVKQLFKNLATHLPGIQSSGSSSPGFAASADPMREGGAQAQNDRIKLTAQGVNQTNKQKGQQNPNQKKLGCC